MRVVGPIGAPEFDSYYYPEGFGVAIADDLRSAGIFEAVEFVAEGPADDHRYHLTGVLRETPLRNSTTSFGLGMFGVLLWLLPVPMSKTTAEVALDLELSDSLFSWHFGALRRGMLEARQAMAAALAASGARHALDRSAP